MHSTTPSAQGRWALVSRGAITVTVTVAALVLALVTSNPAYAQDPPFDRGIDEACREGARTADPFADVASGATHAEAASCLWAYGIAQGRFVDGENVYDPRAAVTREQMASFIARTIAIVPDDVYALPERHEQALFEDSDDISAGHLASVNQLTDAGIVEGFGDGTFQPAAALDRAEMASFIVRAVEEVTDEALERAPVFDDISGTHRANIEKLASIGVTAGKADGVYAPDDPITREQMASFLARSLDHLVAEDVLEPLGFDPGDGGARLGLVDVDLGMHDGFDRITFTLEGDDRDAGWRVEYVEEAIQQGSGNVVEVEGEAILAVDLTGMALPPDLPEDVEDDLVSPQTIGFDGDGIVEVVVGSVFEGHQQVFIGTTGRQPFTVQRLDDPQRVYIDVTHAP